MEEIEFSRWLFEGRLRQGKNVMPDGLNWLCYFVGNSKSHRENSIYFLFLESSDHLNMKNVVKFSKHFFGYFNTLETHSKLLNARLIDNDFGFRKSGWQQLLEHSYLCKLLLTKRSSIQNQESLLENPYWTISTCISD